MALHYVLRWDKDDEECATALLQVREQSSSEDEFDLSCERDVIPRIPVISGTRFIR